MMKKRTSLEKIDKKLLVKRNSDISIATLPVELIFLTLPYKKIEGNVFTMESKDKNLAISIVSGMHGLPFGIYPRLLLYYICSEVKRTNQRQIKLGNSFKDILERMKVSGKTSKLSGSQLSNFKDQFLKLFSSNITIQGVKSADEKKKRISYLNIMFAEGISFWEGSNELDYEIVLTEPFFNYIKETSSTIFDYNIIASIKESPLLLDLYIFLNHQAYIANYYGKDIFISYKQLYAQFGTQSNTREFKRLIKNNLIKLSIVHLGLMVEEIMREKENGILVKKNSVPSIEAKQIPLDLFENDTNL